MELIMRDKPVFPRTYAEKVVEHAQKQKRRGRNPSEPFLEERNPAKALKAAKEAISPNNQVIRERLLNLEKYLPRQQSLIYSFAEYLASRINPDIVAEGFVLGAQLALYDIKQGVDGCTGQKLTGILIGQPQMIYNILHMFIPAIARAIFPNDFASRVNKFMDDVNQDVVQNHKKAKVVAPPTAMPDDTLIVYTAMRKIADLAFEIWGEDPEHASLNDRRGEKVNPFYDQTTGGLFIEQYYSSPGSIWTPWGKWGCFGGGSHSGNAAKKLMEKFLRHIGKVELAIPVQNPNMGTIGPIYAVLQVGDVVLPKPEKRERLSYLGYKDANRLWAEVEAKFMKQK